MSTVSYNLVSDSKGKSLTILVDDGDVGQTLVVPESHPNFKKVLDALLDGADDGDWLKAQLDVGRQAGTKMRALSERVRVAGNSLFFDGDPINGALIDHILRLLDDEDEAGYKALVNFLEKLYTNPSPESIQSLYSWIHDRNFTITPDGDFIAYKGVAVDSEGVSRSISQGSATVNGVVHTGAIPNPEGAVVEMPRSQVNPNTGVGCSTGLHAGTWGYASDFARGRVLTVKINPRDVVSVPDDCQFQKLRVARYTVLTTTEQAYEGPTWSADEEYDEEDVDDYGYDWDDEDGDLY